MLLILNKKAKAYKSMTKSTINSSKGKDKNSDIEENINTKG